LVKPNIGLPLITKTLVTDLGTNQGIESIHVVQKNAVGGSSMVRFPLVIAVPTCQESILGC
jgi:hypothetical protein